MNVEEEAFCREPKEAVGDESSSVGVTLLLGTVNAESLLRS